MAAAEGEKEPDEEQARETFAQLFGSGAFAFGRAAGSFSILDGVMTIPTVSLAGGATTILADGKFDLNALTLASDWMVRATGQARRRRSLRAGALLRPDRRRRSDRSTSTRF